MRSTLAATLHFTVRNEQAFRYAASVKPGMCPASFAFIGIPPFSLHHHRLYSDTNVHSVYSLRHVIYTVNEKYAPLSFYVLSACPSEEETSAAAAKRPCILPKKCSVRERAGISLVFCAVSIKSSKVICVILSWKPLVVEAEKAEHLASKEKRNSVNVLFRQLLLSPYLDLENTQRLGLPYMAEEGTPTPPTSSSVQTNIELCTYW